MCISLAQLEYTPAVCLNVCKCHLVDRTTQMQELETLLSQNKDKVEQMKTERTDLIAKVCMSFPNKVLFSWNVNMDL